ncbi:hypothetical protein [Chryseobacterium sp. S90]|uniref:hypothetical protein n=1 Tax=Chryseobacterium sp. S90 TaxID=3395373 RepID=UPI0039BC8DD4
MKNIIKFLLIFVISCKSLTTVSEKENVTGIYKLENQVLYQALSDNNNYGHLILKSDNTYILSHAPANFSPTIEQCDYASKGQWKQISNDIVDITSENYYLKQDGFKYELKKEKKSSNDSIYLKIIFPEDYHPVKFTYRFNDGKWYTTNKKEIVLSKDKYLLMNPANINRIGLRLDVDDVSGVTLYRSRTMFEILREDIDTDKYNYITINLPHFNQCFFDFEPYYHNYIFIKNKNTLMWKGEKWIRQ